MAEMFSKICWFNQYFNSRPALRTANQHHGVIKSGVRAHAHIGNIWAAHLQAVTKAQVL